MIDSGTNLKHPNLGHVTQLPLKFTKSANSTKMGHKKINKQKVSTKKLLLVAHVEIESAWYMRPCPNHSKYAAYMIMLKT